MKKIKLDISGMHCAACSQRIEKVLGRKDGIESIFVNLATAKAIVEYDENTIDLNQIQSIIEGLGFKVTEEISGVDTEKANREKYMRGLKISFFISLILTIPLFSAMFFHMAGIHNMLMNGWVQLILATPVQFIIGYRFYKGAFKSLKSGSANMDVLIALGTSTAYFYSLYHLIKGIDEYYFESSAMIITLILLGKILENRAKGKTSEAIKKLMKLTPNTAVILRNGEEQTVDIDEVIVGDIIIIKPGEQIPVDGEIIYGNTSIDESMITGESIPVEKNIGDEVVGGTINKNGMIKFKANRIGKDTTLAKIIKMVEDAQGSKAPVQRLADKISGIFVPSVVIISIVTFIIWYFFSSQNGDMNKALISAVAVLVIACPCALGLATPTAIMVGTGKGAENGILIKSGEHLERAHDLDSIIFDKTGTITKGEPIVTNIYFENIDRKEFIALSASAEKASEHPLGESIVSFAIKNKVSTYEIEDFESFTGKGIKANIKRNEVLIGNRSLMDMWNIDLSHFENKKNELENEGKTSVLVAINKEIKGIIAIADTIKNESKEAIKMLKEMGIEIYMLTGDNKKTAIAIGNEVGIKEDNIFAEVLPDQKSQKVIELKNKGKKVGMVGDGINDAPALANADIGFAIGTGTDIAMEASDITLIKGDLRAIPKSIYLSKRTMRTIYQNLFWAFGYNTIGIPIAALGFLNPMVGSAAMALSSFSVLTNSLRLRRLDLRYDIVNKTIK